jgi:DNA processing protein
MTAADEAFLALALVPGIGATRLATLLEFFGSPDGALAAPFDVLCTVPELPAQVADAIGRADRSAAGRMLEQLRGLGGTLLRPDDPRFPGLLRLIPDPPACLFALGRLELLARPAVAIIGSRNHSHYGAEVCRAVARAAAGLGLAVVSGMARGLDAVAHAGALDAPGPTIGVLGTGLGIRYPHANRRLYDRVAEHGLLLSEFPPLQRPIQGGFPRRNRLISGMARVTIVVEAALASGALQTAGCAQDQGRDVLAVPGPITSPVSAGTNRLIRDGAAPLLELADLLSYYPEAASRAARLPVPEAGTLPPVEGKVVNALWSGPRRLEELLEATGAPVSEALDAVSALELAGRISQLAGGLYQLAPTRLFGS